MQRQNKLSQIEKEINDFRNILKTEKNKFVLEEKTLEILGEIEAKIGEIILDKKDRSILEKEEVFKRYLSLNKIESEYDSIDDFLDELIKILSKELQQRKIKLNYDIFEAGNSKIEGNGNSREKIEVKISQKNKIFLRVLHKLGIDFGEVTCYEEEINPNRMRKIPYNIYQINSGENKKTIIISDEIGQATFVYDELISPEIFQIIEKGEEINGNKALKIIYNKKTFEKNLEIALNKTIKLEEKQEKIINEEEEKEDIVKENLTKEELFEKLWNYEGRSEQESYDYFMGLSYLEIQKLEIRGNKITSLKNLSGIEIKGFIYTHRFFQKWIEKIFEGKDIDKNNIKIVELNEKSQVVIGGIIYTSITQKMKQEDYPDLPDNGQNILKKIKKLSEEEKINLILEGKEARLGTTTVKLYNLSKIQEKFGLIKLDEKNQVEIDGDIYTAITATMKQEDYPDLPDNGDNILRKIKKLSEEEKINLILEGKEARIGTAPVELYNLSKIQEKFGLIKLDEKNQVEIDGVIYTAITGTMKQEDYPDLPDNGFNIFNKIKKLSEEEKIDLILEGREARLGKKTVKLYNLSKIQEMFGVIKLDEKNQVEIDGVIYTAITRSMKQEDYPDLPDNGFNIFNKIKKLSEEEKIDLILEGKEARIGTRSVELYNLSKIQEKFKKK